MLPPVEGKHTIYEGEGWTLRRECTYDEALTKDRELWYVTWDLVYNVEDSKKVCDLWFCMVLYWSIKDNRWENAGSSNEWLINRGDKKLILSKKDPVRSTVSMELRKIMVSGVGGLTFTLDIPEKLGRSLVDGI
jgi:hypothetical protein